MVVKLTIIRSKKSALFGLHSYFQRDWEKLQGTMFMTHTQLRHTVHESIIPNVMGSDVSPDPRLFKAVMVILIAVDVEQWEAGIFITYLQILSGQEVKFKVVSEYEILKV